MYREKYYLWQFYFVKCDLEFLLFFFVLLSTKRCHHENVQQKPNIEKKIHVCVNTYALEERFVHALHLPKEYVWQ